MSKKSFKDNPALQFISTAGTEETAEAVETAEATETAEAEVPEEQEQAAFLPRSTEKPPEGYKLNPLYVEKKSRRLQLVLQPSLYERVKAGAAAAGLSVNEYVHQILDSATKGE